MKDNTNNPLVVSEIAGLWGAYMNEKISTCTFKYFLNNVEDKEIQGQLQNFLNLSEKHILKLENFFYKENLPLPKSFTENDVDINAPRLYTDAYYLFYLNTMASFGMDSYSLIIRSAPRSDIRQYFSECLIEALELTNETMDLLLSKGLFVKPPRMEVSKDVTFVKRENFLSGFLGTPRSILAREASNLYNGLLIDTIIKGLVVGFGQTARSKEVRDYMFKGRDFMADHYQAFFSTLSKEEIPVPSTYDTFVTDSTIPPFSDRLMMYHTLAIYIFALAVDGASIASTMRSDLMSTFVLFGSEITKLISEGSTILINNGWMEQPPQIISHKKLVEV